MNQAASFINLTLDNDSLSTLMPFLVVVTITTYALLLLSVQSFHVYTRTAKSLWTWLKSKKQISKLDKSDFKFDASASSITSNEALVQSQFQKVDYFEKRNKDLETEIDLLRKKISEKEIRISEISMLKDRLDVQLSEQCEKTNLFQEKHSNLELQLENMSAEKNRLTQERDELLTKNKEFTRQKELMKVDISPIQEAALALQKDRNFKTTSGILVEGLVTKNTSASVDATALGELGNIGALTNLQKLAEQTDQSLELAQKNRTIEKQAKEIENLKNFLQFCKKQIIQIQQSIPVRQSQQKAS